MEIQEVIEKFRYGAPLNYQTVIRKLKHDKITDVAITRKEYIDTILNYIDKLQKENAELKEEIEHKQETIDKIMKELEEFYKKYDVVSKDKIRELREIDNIDYLQFKLKELLGE